MFCFFFLAQDLAANSNVQDAFVIAVEKQARERLERLSALKKIKPVDMTKLSQQVTVNFCI
jgi:MAGUK p55 subfamily protein 5